MLIDVKPVVLCSIKNALLVANKKLSCIWYKNQILLIVFALPNAKANRVYDDRVYGNRGGGTVFKKKCRRQKMSVFKMSIINFRRQNTGAIIHGKTGTAP